MARSNHDDFDGYRKWLGITNKKRLPTHYELLGISLDEDDPEVIQAAAEQRRHFVESKRGDGHDAIVTEILYRISEAENTLLNNEMRRDYDRQRKLWEKRQKNRQIDPIASRSRVRSRPEPTVGEGTGFVSTFAGILGVFCVAIAIMTWFSFQLPWFESADQVEAAPIVQVPAPVAAPAQVAPVAVKPDLAKPQATEPVKTVVKLDKPLAIANVDRAAVTVPPSAEVERATIADEITNSIGMKLKLIRAGEFLMGSPDNETGRDSDETQHRVQLTTSYYLGVTEVTQGQWFAMMQTKPWSGKEFAKEGEDYPATYVSWDDAVEYSVKLSAAEGKTYRLPTEAEWEYACRGGKSTAYSFGSDATRLKDYAWLRANASAIGELYPHEVGTKQSNPFGLHDMHGNVYEWCSDWDAYYDSSFAVDPSGPLTGSIRVFRGGSCFDEAADCRAAFRLGIEPAERGCLVGFRLALSPSVKSDSQRPKLKGNLTVEALDFEIVSPGQRATIADEITNSIGMKLKLIRAGEFLMGSPDNETGRGKNETQHRVQLTTSYYLGVTEVTQGQWFAMMQTKPWEGQEDVKEGEDYPATNVSWDDAVEYSVKLSAAEGKTYRLPTEAEWEYACRGGKSTAYSFGNDSSQLSSYSWWGGFLGDGNAKTEQYAHEVGGKQSNPFGLHDMHGNVLEWCSDWQAVYDSSFAVDPSGPLTGWLRVYRGGSWGFGAANCRSAYRYWLVPRDRSSYLGFRLALSPSVK